MEHAFQAAKTRDLEIRKRFQNVSSPAKAKKIGRRLKLGASWEQLKVRVMRGLIQQKFSQPEFRGLLLETGTQHLTEGNMWCDNFWGQCGCDKCASTRGGNKLGTLIMEVRIDLELGIL